MKKKLYDATFYKNMDKMAYNSASIVIPMVLSVLPKVGSVIDFGCGQGMWLSVLKENGVTEIKGLDGSWVNKESLKIDSAFFEEADLNKAIVVDKKYDLAISLEVAEHLPAQAAGVFVKSLAGASDFILFSAAIPYQGGTDHINEQWPTYWTELFNQNGFVCIDFLRKKLWHIDKVAPYYRQNILMFVKEEQL